MWCLHQTRSVYMSAGLSCMHWNSHHRKPCNVQLRCQTAIHWFPFQDRIERCFFSQDGYQWQLHCTAKHRPPKSLICNIMNIHTTVLQQFQEYLTFLEYIKVELKLIWTYITCRAKSIETEKDTCTCIYIVHVSSLYLKVLYSTQSHQLNCWPQFEGHFSNIPTPNTKNNK